MMGRMQPHTLQHRKVDVKQKDLRKYKGANSQASLTVRILRHEIEKE